MGLLLPIHQARDSNYTSTSADCGFGLSTGVSSCRPNRHAFTAQGDSVFPGKRFPISIIFAIVSTGFLTVTAWLDARANFNFTPAVLHSSSIDTVAFSTVSFALVMLRTSKVNRMRFSSVSSEFELEQAASRAPHIWSPIYAECGPRSVIYTV